MKEGELLEKLERKYERPTPGVCVVCCGKLTIAHSGGGLPLRWVCEEALAQVGSDDEQAQSHLDESACLDYRRVGDARVMQLIEMYRDLRAKVPADEAAAGSVETTLD